MAQVWCCSSHLQVQLTSGAACIVRMSRAGLTQAQAGTARPAQRGCCVQWNTVAHVACSGTLLHMLPAV